MTHPHRALVARYVNTDIAEYLIPVNADVNELEVILVPEIDREVNPAGVKRLSEIGNVITGAAIANAVFHATGKRVRELPITLDKVLAESGREQFGPGRCRSIRYSDQ